MEQENQELLELLQKMLKENEDANKQLKKQLLYSKIFACAGCVLAVIMAVVFLRIVPPLLVTMDTAVEAMNQASDAMGQATQTLELVDETLAILDDALNDFSGLFEEQGLVVQSSEALSEAMEKIESMDIVSLNEAIRNLGEVVEPLANFFGRFR